jgi:hypothetical protein
MRARPDTRGTRDRSSAFAGGRRREIVDEMIDDYVSWRAACAAVAVSYENWRCSDRRNEKLAFSAYVAALDREEQAAAAYQCAVAQVATALAGRHSSSLEASSTDGPNRSAEVTEVRLAGDDRREGDWLSRGRGVLSRCARAFIVASGWP